MANVDRNRRNCFTFIWKVENSRYYEEESIESPNFVMGEIGDMKWFLYLDCFQKDEENPVVFFELAKKPEKEGPDSTIIDYELAFFTDETLLKSWMKTKRIFSRTEIYDSETRKAFDPFRVDLLTPHDILTLRCRVWKTSGEFTEDVRCVARTCIGVQKRSFTWSVGNFSALEPNRKQSYQIESLSTRGELATLDLFLTPDETIRFIVTRTDEKIRFYSFQFSLAGASGNTLENLKEKNKFFLSPDSRDFAQFFVKTKLMEKADIYLPGDVLSLRCKCTFCYGIVLESIYDYTSGNREEDSVFLDRQIMLSSPQTELIDNLKSMLNNGSHSDMQLKTSAKTYSGHKCILSARSPVFQAMFEKEMKENLNHCVDIEDLNDDTVLLMLQYIYSADIELEWVSATELYEAADKYEVLGLKNVCSSYLKMNLLHSNACEALALADLHQDEDLKGFVQDFILRHGADVINSEDWQKLMETDLKLAAETMCRIYKKTTK